MLWHQELNTSKISVMMQSKGLHSDEHYTQHAMYACDTQTSHENGGFLGMGRFANEDIHERDDIKLAHFDPYYCDRPNIHEKNIIEMCPHVNETPFAIESINESFSLFPTMTSSASNITRKQPQVSPQVEERALVNQRPLPNVEPLLNDTACEHENTILDICKLIAESQDTNSSTQELAKAGELYTPRSAMSRRRSLSNPSDYKAELVKKVSFGSRTPSPGTDSEPPQEQPQPSLYHQQQPTKQHKKKKSFSQTTQSSRMETSNGDDSTHCGDGPRQENYALFRTRSGRAERQLSRLQSRQQQEHQKGKTGDVHGRSNRTMSEGSVSAGRYFDALKGPELEILKDSEEVLLPLDKAWPFLLRFPIGCFGICLGLASQAILWKVLATSPSMAFLHVPSVINVSLWWLALAALVIIFITYTLKCLLYFEAVRREFHHPVRVNFFFAPWIVCMFLAIGTPPSITTSIHPSLWCVFMSPLLILELKIYGQWLSGGQRKLSKVANASTHLSLVGNFVSALLAAQIGWKEPALFCWAVGSAHYLVLFVTLYQRLPSAGALPKELHPVFFLFVAAPSTASVAWKFLVGNFDRVSRIAYFNALFLYASLAVRVKFFCGIQFSVTWWAYTYPMTASAIATVHYSIEVRNLFTQVLAIILSVIATLMLILVFICTILHVMWGSLFPNDIAIAITTRRHGIKHKEKNDLSSAISSNKVLNDSKTHIVEGSDRLMRKRKTSGMALRWFSMS